MARLHKDGVWEVPPNDMTWESAQLSVLMDLRDELKLISGELAVLRQHIRVLPDAVELTIPHILKGIRRKIPARKKANE